MVSHSSHNNHVFLILVVQVTNVSFAIESFATYEKVLIMMLHMKRISTSKTLVILVSSFVSLIWPIYWKLSYEKFSKKTGDQNLQKHL